jgi:glycosyltransferase involved in cell wall biosynthesis
MYLPLLGPIGRRTGTALHLARGRAFLEASLIIPAHNEEERLPETIAAYLPAMNRKFGDDFEVVVVANGCSDGTTGVAAEAEEVWPQIKVIDIPMKVGKGGAIVEGFRQANGEKITFADADGATAPGSLIELFEELESHDVVIGSRKLRDSDITAAQPLNRRLFGAAFALVSHLIFPLPVKDTQCGAKAFRADAARRLANETRERNWTFDLDLVLSACRLDLDIHEFPVVWADQDGSQLRFFSTSWKTLKSLCGLKLRQRSSYRLDYLLHRKQARLGEVPVSGGSE